MNEKKHFGFIEMIGSIVMLFLDPNRRNNKKYLNEKYILFNRIIGVIILLFLLIVLLDFLNEFIK